MAVIIEHEAANGREMLLADLIKFVDDARTRGATGEEKFEWFTSGLGQKIKRLRVRVEDKQPQTSARPKEIIR